MPLVVVLSTGRQCEDEMTLEPFHPNKEHWLQRHPEAGSSHTRSAQAEGLVSREGRRLGSGKPGSQN